MKLTKGLMVISLCAILVAACKKKEDDSTPKPSATEKLLTSGSWLLNDLKINGADANDEIDDCEWDDIYTYFSDHRLTVDQGANVCDSSQGLVWNFAWKFSANETYIIQNDEASKISSISETKLVLTYDDGFDLITYEYKKK